MGADAGDVHTAQRSGSSTGISEYRDLKVLF